MQISFFEHRKSPSEYSYPIIRLLSHFYVPFEFSQFLKFMKIFLVNFWNLWTFSVLEGGNFWRWGLGKSEWVRNLLGYDIYTWHLNPTIFTVYRFNNVFSTFHTPPKSAPGAPFYIRTNHEKLLGLIVLNLRNIFLQSCFRVPSRWKVPLKNTLMKWNLCY